MRYAIIDKSKAVDVGINIKNTLRKEDKIIVNENTIMRNRILKGALTDRVERLEGEILTNEQAKQMIKTEKYEL